MVLKHVALIEREQLLRTAWEELIRSFHSCWVAGSFASAQDFCLRGGDYAYDVIVLHLSGSWDSSSAEFELVNTRRPPASIVAIVPLGDAHVAPAALGMGAGAVICTSAEPVELHEAILTADPTRPYLCRTASVAVSHYHNGGHRNPPGLPPH